MTENRFEQLLRTGRRLLWTGRSLGRMGSLDGVLAGYERILVPPLSRLNSILETLSPPLPDISVGGKAPALQRSFSRTLDAGAPGKQERWWSVYGLKAAVAGQGYDSAENIEGMPDGVDSGSRRTQASTPPQGPAFLPESYLMSPVGRRRGSEGNATGSRAVGIRSETIQERPSDLLSNPGDQPGEPAPGPTSVPYGAARRERMSQSLGIAKDLRKMVGQDAGDRRGMSPREEGPSSLATPFPNKSGSVRLQRGGEGLLSILRQNLGHRGQTMADSVEGLLGGHAFQRESRDERPGGSAPSSVERASGDDGALPRHEMEIRRAQVSRSAAAHSGGAGGRSIRVAEGPFEPSAGSESVGQRRDAGGPPEDGGTPLRFSAEQIEQIMDLLAEQLEISLLRSYGTVRR